MWQAMNRIFAALCYGLGGASLVAAALLLAFGEDGTAVAIDEPQRTPQLRLGQTETLEFRIHNPTRREARIIGLTCC
jgi:hypothetical protein